MPLIQVDLDALSHVARLLESSAAQGSPGSLVTIGRPLVDEALSRNDSAWERHTNVLDAFELAGRVRACRSDILSLEHALVETIRALDTAAWV